MEKTLIERKEIIKKFDNATNVIKKILRDIGEERMQYQLELLNQIDDGVKKEMMDINEYR